MAVRPKSEIWRSVARTVGHDLGWGNTLSQWISDARGQRPGSGRALRVLSAPREWWLRALVAMSMSRSKLTTTLDRLTPGGEVMIFRKDSRGETFQRQISNLRQQIQPEEETSTSDYRYEESHDTSQFNTTSASVRDEPYAPPRTSDTLGSAQAAAPAATGPAYRGAWQTADSSTSVIAANAHWNGTLRSEGSLHVHGRADGELHAANDLYVAEGAQVDAEIFADNVVVAGTVHGRIDARSRLEVLPQGHVSGDVQAPKLVVHEGARLTGQLKMNSGATGSASSPYSSAAQPAKSRRSNQ